MLKIGGGGMGISMRIDEIRMDGVGTILPDLAHIRP